MTDLSDFKRMVYEPETKALRDQISTVKRHMKGRCDHLTTRAVISEGREAFLRQALTEAVSDLTMIANGAPVRGTSIEEACRERIEVYNEVLEETHLMQESS